MKPVETPHELIDCLARRGDPVAFHTLFAGKIDESYRRLREQGKSDEEALATLRTLIRETYRAFLHRPPADSAEEWYDERAARHIGASTGPPAEEVSLDTLVEPAAAPPHDDIRIEIQRAHSEWARGRKRRTKSHHAGPVRPAAAPAIGLALALLVVAAGYGWLVLSGNRLSVTLEADSGESRGLTLPFGVERDPTPAVTATTPGDTLAETKKPADSSIIEADTTTVERAMKTPHRTAAPRSTAKASAAGARPRRPPQRPPSPPAASVGARRAVRSTPAPKPESPVPSTPRSSGPAAPAEPPPEVVSPAPAADNAPRSAEQHEQVGFGAGDTEEGGEGPDDRGEEPVVPPPASGAAEALPASEATP